jgi:hypothetical protein
LSNNEVGNISITDINGKELIRTQTSGQNTQIDLSNLSKGVYILNLEINGQMLKNKIIIQ